jgi:hypothetical protein
MNYKLKIINTTTSYKNTVGKSDFYNIDYAQDWTEEPFAIMAKIIKKYFNPKSSIDIGTGMGFLVKHLQKENINAIGTELSLDFINHSPVGKSIKNLDLSTAKPGDLKEKFDFVSAMEVLEHFPSSYLDNIIAFLKSITKTYLFITVPAHGPNTGNRYYGLPMVSNNEWFKEGRKQGIFKHIVVNENNIPHHGHLTLATYTWWTNLFLRNGLKRCYDIEDIIYEEQKNDIRRFNWNLFILRKIDSDSLIIPDTQYLLGNGWYTPESSSVWSKYSSELFLNSTKNILKFTVNVGPKELLYNRQITIKLYNCADIRKCFLQKEISITPGNWKSFEISIPKKYTTLKVEINTNTFNPSKIFNNTDNRDLGICIKSVQASQ